MECWARARSAGLVLGNLYPGKKMQRLSKQRWIGPNWHRGPLGPIKPIKIDKIQAVSRYFPGAGDPATIPGNTLSKDTGLS